MKKVENICLFLACLQEGDSVYVSFEKDGPIHTAVFDGWLDDDSTIAMLSHFDGMEKGYLNEPVQNMVFFSENEQAFVCERSPDVVELLVPLVRSGMERIEAIGTIIDGFQDADTVLADIHVETDTEVSGGSLGLLDIWIRSTDKRSLEDFFEALFGIKFAEWLLHSYNAIKETLSKEAPK